MDAISSQELMNVHGALQYSLSKVIQTPEVPRIYTVSLWDEKKFKDNSTKDRILSDENELSKDLEGLIKNNVVMKLNDLIKRARLVKAHSLVIGTLSEKMTWLFQDSKKKELITDLDKVYVEIQRKHKVPEGDFPELHNMRVYFNTYE